MFKVKHQETEQECAFDTQEGLEGFMDGTAEPEKWKLVEAATGTNVVLDGKPITEVGDPASLSDSVLTAAAQRVAAGDYSLAYAASGIATFYKQPRDKVFAQLSDLVAQELAISIMPTDVEAELEKRAKDRIAAANEAKAAAEENSGG